MNGIDKIERFLSESDCKWTIRHVEECRSTNEEILKIIQNETELASKGVVLISNWQSHGKGRRGAKWESGKSKDLLFSIAISPTINPSHWTRLTHASALGISIGLKKLNYKPEIKWPNDIYINGCKVAGILVESYPDIDKNGIKGGVAVIGVGLNINSKKEDYCNSYRAPATSLLEESKNNLDELDRFLIAGSILKELHLQTKKCEKNFDDVLLEIKELSSVYGKKVEVQLATGISISGTVTDFGNEGEIVIEKETSSLGRTEVEIISSAYDLRFL